MNRFIYIYNPATAPSVNLFGLPPNHQIGGIHQIYTLGGANGTPWWWCLWGKLCRWLTEYPYYSYHREPTGLELLVPTQTLIVVKLLWGLPDKMVRLLLGGVTRVALADSGVDTSQKQLCLTRPSCLARYKIYTEISFTHLIYPHFTHNFDTFVKQTKHLRLFIQTHSDGRRRSNEEGKAKTPRSTRAGVWLTKACHKAIVGITRLIPLVVI